MANGDYKVICDASGFEVWASDTRKQWNGLRVHKDFWEPCNPQDRLVVGEDDQSVPDPRPEQPDVFLEPNEVKAENL